MTANSLLVQFAGNAICFNSNDSKILKSLTIHFKNCISSGSSVVANYEIFADAEDNFSARVDSVDLFSNSSIESALSQLMQDALLKLNGASKTELIFHAAALAHRDDAVILCGKTASGKSSLAAWLTALGLAYMTDEVISVPINSESVNGFCRSIVLKPGSSFIWKRWLKNQDSEGFLRFADNSVWIEPSLLNPDGAKATATPRLIIFPHYESDAAFRVERITRAGALFRLLQHLVNARNFPDYGMAAASRLARRLTAYTLTYSDIETASAWIQQTIQNS